MKLLSILLLLLSTFSTIGYAQSNARQQFIGSWDLHAAETIDLMSYANRAKFDSLDVDTQSQIIAQLESQRFIFDSDSSFTVSTNQGSNQGSWNVNDDQLTLTFQNGTQTTQTIEELLEDRIILKIVSNPNSQALIQRIALLPAIN